VDSRTGEGAWKKIKEMPALYQRHFKIKLFQKCKSNVKEFSLYFLYSMSVVYDYCELCLWILYFYHRFILFVCV